MKIAIFVPSWPPGCTPNGIVTYASQLVPALRALGHEVFVISDSRNSAGAPDPYAIDLRQFTPTQTLYNRAAQKLIPEYATFTAAASRIVSAIRHLVEQCKVDVLEIEETFGWSFETSRSKLLPVVVRLHGPWFLNGRFDGPSNGRRDLQRIQRERRGIETADFVSAPSAEVLQSVRDWYGISLPASQAIPNPLVAAAEAETWSAQTCHKDSLLYVGRFDSRKGGDLVLKVFAELAQSDPNITLTFVGPDRGISVSNGTAIGFEEYARRTLPVRCRSRINFLGTLKHSEVMALRAKSFATLVASQYEPFGYVVLEAMSLGCAIVATAVGGIPELIEDQRNGLLVPSQDVHAMVTACRRLLDDHTLAARLGRQAWQDCRDFYAPENLAEQTVAAYQAAIDAFKMRSRSHITSTPANRCRASERA